MRTGQQTWRRWALAAAVGLTAADPARGFYFNGWPGSPTPPRTLTPSPGPPGTQPPPPRVTDRTEVPPVDGKPDPQGPPGDPTPATPEPGTAVLAALGLGLAAAARRARRR